MQLLFSTHKRQTSNAWIFIGAIIGALLVGKSTKAQTGPLLKVVPPPNATELLRKSFPNGLPNSPTPPGPKESSFFWLYENGKYSTTLQDCEPCTVSQAAGPGQLIFVVAYRPGVFKTMSLRASIHGRCDMDYQGSIYSAGQDRPLNSSSSNTSVNYDPARHEFSLFENTAYLVDPGTDVQQARGSACSAYIYAGGHEVQAQGTFSPSNILLTVDVVTNLNSSVEGFLSVPIK